jgi:iron complex outermembrane receptor protein
MRELRVIPRIVCAVLFAASAGSVLAQATGGRVAGTIRDAFGAAVSGAAVTITNQETGASRVVRSSPTGAYEAADLPPGLYTVSTDVQGFAKIVHRDQRVAAGATLTIDLTLELKVSEEVKVTAMKREETVFSTPISIAAPTEDVLQERGVDSLEGVAANVADFSVQNLGPGQSTVAMRGVSAGQIARDQPGVKEEVSAYLDESVISLSLFTPDMDLFDMNRVEVLRGPQGSLFGSGSIGGAVRYISNQPLIGTTQFFGEVGGAAIDGGGLGGDAKVGLNTPISDNAAFRVAAYYNRIAGWMDAVQPDLSIKKNVNPGDRTGVRMAFEFAPDPDLTITPRFVYQKVTAEGWNRIDEYNILANPFTTTRPQVTLGDRKLFTQIDEPFSDKFTLGDLNIRYNFGDFALTSVTSFTNRQISVVRDSGALTSSVTGGTIGEPESVYTLDAPLTDLTRASGWTQELRLSSDKGRFRWLVGGFYADTKRRYGQTDVVKGFEDLSCALGPSTCIRTEGVYAPKDNLYWSDIKYKAKEYGIFAEGTFSFTNAFSLTAGLRYYNYKVNKSLIFDGLFSDLFPNPDVQPEGTTKADGVAPRFIVSYNIGDSTTLNAQASKGFRLGGINDPILVPLCSPQDLVTFGSAPTWDDETAWNYEIGSKTRFMGGRASVNASAFYVDVKDLQVVVTAGTCSSRLVFNVPKARSIGGELEFAMAPNEHFDFALSGSYNDATVRTTLSPESTAHATGIRKGNRLPAVPKFQMALSATYQQDIVYGFRGYVNGNYQHIGSRYTQLVDQEPGVGIVPLQNAPGALGHTIGGPLTQDFFTFDPLLPAYDILNLRLGVRCGGWDVAFFVNNITDERAFLAIDRERGFLARQAFLTNPPRTFGLTTRFDF